MIGEPYDPKLSIPQLVARRLQNQLPNAPVTIRWVAGKGSGLNQLRDSILEELERSPDVLLFMFGHNEFLSAFSSDLGCSYKTTLLARASTQSALIKYLYDRYRRKDISQPPTASQRALFDRPIVCRETFNSVMDQVAADTAAIAKKAREMRVPTVFIAPSGNEFDFAPNRSVLQSEDGASEIENALRCGAILFQLGRLPEAEAELRRALAIDHEFAAGHYWLARVLVSGHFEGAGPHFRKAVENDQFPYRAQRVRNDITRAIAEAYQIPFVDTEKIVRPLSTRGFLDGMLYHDIHHGSVIVYNAVAMEVVNRLTPVLGLSPSPRISDEEALRSESFTQQDWLGLFESRAKWLEAFAAYTYDSAPRLELALALRGAVTQLRQSISKSGVDSSNEIAIARIRQRLEGALDLERKLACRAGCREKLGSFCEQPERSSDEPWQLRSSFMDARASIKYWLDRALAAPISKIHVGGVEATPTKCHLRCEDGLAPDGTALMLDGLMYLDGFGLHPSQVPSSINVMLGEKYKTFSALVGIGDTGGPTSSAHCSVEGDGRVLVDTPILRWRTNPFPLSISVMGVRELILRCDRGGDSANEDVVVWANTRLVKAD